MTFKGKFPIIEKIDGFKKSIIVRDNSGKTEKFLEIIVQKNMFAELMQNHFYEIEYFVYSKEYNGKWYSSLEAVNINLIH